MAWSFALLAMEAAGMIVDYEGNQRQKRFNKEGLRLEEAALDANLQMTRLQAEDASLQSLQNLRKNLGSQAAYFAANGSRANPAFAQESISNQGQDERMRRLNLMGKEAELQAQKQFARLNYKSQNAKMDQQFIGRVFNAIPFSSLPDLFSGGNKPNSARSNTAQRANSYASGFRNFGMKPYQG